MRSPLFVRPQVDAERTCLTAGLRSSDAFVLRRCQILLASARGEIPRVIGEQHGCNDQTVRIAIAAFNTRSLDALHAWADDQPLRLIELSRPKDDPDLKALARYGLLVRRATAAPDQVWLRFVDGRPVSARTTQSRSWSGIRLRRSACATRRSRMRTSPGESGWHN